MGLFSEDISSMDGLFLQGLRQMLYVENHILSALPKMVEKATNRDLKTGLLSHLDDTKKQIKRLAAAFEKLGQEPDTEVSPAIDGLIKEADRAAAEVTDKSALDAALIGAAQAVEHYEIARYGTLIAWARDLGHAEIVRLLQTNLNEEKSANSKLNTVALRKGVNLKAAS